MKPSEAVEKLLTHLDLRERIVKGALEALEAHHVMPGAGQDNLKSRLDEITLLRRIVLCADFEAGEKRTHHAGDCTFYVAVINHTITDGICTCGYGLQYRYEHDGDESQLISKERLDSRW